MTAGSTEFTISRYYEIKTNFVFNIFNIDLFFIYKIIV